MIAALLQSWEDARIPVHRSASLLAALEHAAMHEAERNAAKRIAIAPTMDAPETGILPALGQCLRLLFSAVQAADVQLRIPAARLLAVVLRLDKRETQHVVLTLAKVSPQELARASASTASEPTPTSQGALGSEVQFFTSDQRHHATSATPASVGGFVTPADFETTVRALRQRARDILKLNTTTATAGSDTDQDLRQALGMPDVQTPTGGRQARKLVLTKTTKENLATVVEAIDSATPLLLQGATGVGKSATIAAAVEFLGKPPDTLVRMNMSSKVTVDDLLGKVMVHTGPNGREEFVFEPMPFTVAFRE